MQRCTRWILKINSACGSYPVRVRVRGRGSGWGEVELVDSRCLRVYSVAVAIVCVVANMFEMCQAKDSGGTRLAAEWIESMALTAYMAVSAAANVVGARRLVEYQQSADHHNRLFDACCDGAKWCRFAGAALAWTALLSLADTGLRLRLASGVATWPVAVASGVGRQLAVVGLAAFTLRFAINVADMHAHFRVVNQLLVHTHTQQPTNYHLLLPTGGGGGGGGGEMLTIAGLSDLHWRLCNMVETTNNIFGGQLLAAMLCIFVHIIITPYFLFLDILYPTPTPSPSPTPTTIGILNISYLLVQSLWIFTHLIQLILLVLPCAATTQQANRTSSIVCKLLNRPMTLETRKQLETFVMQLIHHNAEFSACGLFRLNLPVITSVAGAVTTYLVILIQFQNSDSTTQIITSGRS